MNRRQFLSLGAASATLAGCSTATRHLQDSTEDLTIQRIAILLEKRFSALHGFTIAFVSDLHIGPALSPALLEAVTTFLLHADPDVIVLGGDYLWVPDSTLSRVFDRIRDQRFADLDYAEVRDLACDSLHQLLRRLSPKLGTVGVMGNHDNWSAFHQVPTAFDQPGSELLINQAAMYAHSNQDIEVFGVDDYWTGIPEAPHWQSSTSFKILISHNPDFLETSLSTNSFDLALCGHTHGGQIVLPAVGALSYNVRSSRLHHGTYRVKEKPCVVTSGIGVVEIPYRINCPAEIAFITLVAEESEHLHSKKKRI